MPPPADPFAAADLSASICEGISLADLEVTPAACNWVYPRAGLMPASPDMERGRADLLRFLGEHLARYNLPRSVEYVAEPLRYDAGKVRRSALLEARTARA